MTKFVLHGGFDKHIQYIQDEFFRNALEDTPPAVKIFLVFYAELEEYLELRVTQCKEQFANNKGSKTVEFMMATEENFSEGCAWADIIFLSGGRTVKLVEQLKKFQNVKELFDGKVVVGDSAGVNALMCFYYSKKSKEIGEGLGILPYKVIVHYSEDMGNPLKDTESTLETLFLREYQTMVINV